MDIKKLHNKKINIFNTYYTIKVVDNVISEDREIYGQTDYINKTILIAKTLNGNTLKEADLLLTLLHEITHSIFGEGQYLQASSDEPLVEWTAKCFYQILFKQNQFKGC